MGSLGPFTRTYRNAVKIELLRLSRVPIDPTVVVYQGDMMCWNAAAHIAAPLTVAASAGTFMGVSDTKNPVDHIGVLTSDIGTPRINLIQHGLVEMIVDVADNGATYYPFDTLIQTTDAQTVKKGSSNPVGVVDPGYNTGVTTGSALGRVVATGDYVLMWLRPSATYSAFGIGS